jgi:hypothetical protein
MMNNIKMDEWLASTDAEVIESPNGQYNIYIDCPLNSGVEFYGFGGTMEEAFKDIIESIIEVGDWAANVTKDYK